MEIRRNAFYIELENCINNLCTEKLGLDKEGGECIANGVSEFLMQHFAGQNITFPVDYLAKLAVRDLEIYQKFNGSNYFELAKEYCLSETGVRRVISRTRKRLLQTGG